MTRLVLAWTVIVLSVPVGLLPGPGGIFVFAAGAALLLRHSTKAKRFYVAAARRWPRLKTVMDRALRRRRRGRIDLGTALP